MSVLFWVPKISTANYFLAHCGRRLGLIIHCDWAFNILIKMSRAFRPLVDANCIAVHLSF